ncbi:protein of unknown function [Xenorhabdus doucetiae]|uniref:Uncharacterized protein n=1 Tax=Xenorhabdus doucetiae TaxID=351671 RepID=A0A068QNC3_9GAMM|nr:protein of unknown function [Xenorhabdus doucetiae]
MRVYPRLSLFTGKWLHNYVMNMLYTYYRLQEELKAVLDLILYLYVKVKLLSEM